MTTCRRSRPPYLPKGLRAFTASLFLHGWLVVSAILALLPFAWALFISLCPGYRLSDLGLGRGEGFTLRQYGNFLRDFTLPIPSGTSYVSAFPVTMGNTLPLALASAFGSAVFGTLVGLALARFSEIPKKATLALVFAAVLLPTVSILCVLYQALRALDGLYSLLSYSVLSCAMAIPLGSFLIYGASRRISPSIPEAAILDGASGLRLFQSIHLPLCLPAIGYAALVGFFFPWFDAITQYALLFPVRWTLPLYLWSLAENVPPVFFAGLFIVGLPAAAFMVLTWRYAFLWFPNFPLRGGRYADNVHYRNRFLKQGKAGQLPVVML